MDEQGNNEFDGADERTVVTAYRSIKVEMVAFQTAMRTATENGIGTAAAYAALISH